MGILAKAATLCWTLSSCTEIQPEFLAYSIAMYSVTHGKFGLVNIQNKNLNCSALDVNKRQQSFEQQQHPTNGYASFHHHFQIHPLMKVSSASDHSASIPILRILPHGSSVVAI